MSLDNAENALARLDAMALTALGEATRACVQRTNYKVEPEHWLLALVRAGRGDVVRICKQFRVDLDLLDEQLNTAIDGFRRGDGSRRPDFSPQTSEMIERAWLVASMKFGQSLIRGGYLLYALAERSPLWNILCEQSPELRKIKVPELIGSFLRIVGVAEDEPAGAGTATSTAGAGTSAAVSTTEPSAGGAARAAGGGALERFTIDLTQLAGAGKLDQVLGRDREIDQCVQALSRRKQNNPILVGDAGVGKTAIVEGLANLLAAGAIHSPLLKSAVIRSLDLGALQAGAGVRGEFEQRLRSILAEVRQSPVPVILFIDEAHMLLGAGGAEGQGDAANLLKPALARGELRAIAATTWAEYKKFFEKDAALARRFDPVKVGEPDEQTACYMIRGALGTLERHHGIKVLNEAVEAAVRLSRRYLPGRQLPDKAVSLLDTACTAVALSTAVPPPAIQDCRRRIDDAAHELRLLEREQSAGHGDQGGRAPRIEAARAEAERELAELESRYARECELVQRLRAAWERAGMATGAAGGGTGMPDAAGSDGPSIAALREELRQVQGARPLAHALVDEQAVADVVSRWTGIPLGRMRQDEMRVVQELEERLGRRVIGQAHALREIAQAIRKSRAGLTDPGKPLGVFLLLGTSGVGKTETAMALADILYGGPSQLTVINMSEFKEDAKVSQLLGTSQGYVGYGEGGVLTEAVRRKPHSVLLLDEVEKAARAVHDIFLSVFDKGSVRDGEGRDIDFRNTLIVMTSNAGAAAIAEACAEGRPSPEALLEEVRGPLLQHFRAEFLGRATPIVYYPLGPDELARVVTLQLEKVGQRLGAIYGASLDWDASVTDHVVRRCQDRTAGARVIDRVLNREILPEMSTRVLAAVAGGSRFARVRLRADGTNVQCEIE